MTEKEKFAILEEMMELEVGTLTPESELVDLAEWDSITAISLIVFLDEKFGKTIKGSQIREFKTVMDIIAIMGN